MRPKHLVQLLLGIAISGVALWFVFKGVTLAEIFDSFRSFRYVWLVPSLTIFYFGIWLRGLRWRWLFQPNYDVSLTHAAGGIFIGFAFNSIFPARAGEFIRSYLIGRQENTGFSTAFGTVVAERVLDAVTLLVCLLVALRIAPIPPDSELPIDVFGKEHVLTGAQFLATRQALILSCLVMLAGIVALVLPRPRGWLLQALQAVPFLPRPIKKKGEALVEKFAVGLSCFRSPVQLARLLFASFVIWATVAVSLMFLARGFPDMPMDFVQAFVVVVVICIFIMVPAAPGYWGFYEAGVIFAVVILGIHDSDSTVRSYAILLHLTQWVPIVAIGLPWAWFSHVSMGDVQETKVESEQPSL